MNYGNLTCAKEYAAQYKTEEWIHNYLLNDGYNKEFSDGLKLYERDFIGPIIMPLKLFKRCCGPEDDIMYQIDYKGFELNVSKLMEAVKSNADLPPLIVNYTNDEFVLNDGNHRFEAYSRLEIKECHVIIWTTGKKDYNMFIEKYKKYL